MGVRRSYPFIHLWGLFIRYSWGFDIKIPLFGFLTYARMSRTVYTPNHPKARLLLKL